MKSIESLMFLDLTNHWSTSTEARFTYSIHPQWSPSNRNLHSLSRKSSSIYNTIARGAFYFNADIARYSHSTSACRFGCSCDETVDHVLLRCPHMDNSRRLIISCCTDLGIDFTIQNILKDERLRHSTERLLHHY